MVALVLCNREAPTLRMSSAAHVLIERSVLAVQADDALVGSVFGGNMFPLWSCLYPDRIWYTVSWLINMQAVPAEQFSSVFVVQTFYFPQRKCDFHTLLFQLGNFCFIMTAQVLTGNTAWTYKECAILFSGQLFAGITKSFRWASPLLYNISKIAGLLLNFGRTFRDPFTLLTRLVKREMQTHWQPKPFISCTSVILTWKIKKIFSISYVFIIKAFLSIFHSHLVNMVFTLSKHGVGTDSVSSHVKIDCKSKAVNTQMLALFVRPIDTQSDVSSKREIYTSLATQCPRNITGPHFWLSNSTLEIILFYSFFHSELCFLGLM